MGLKFKVKSKEEIAPEHLPFYAERDGAWVLDVDGAVDKAKLDEFRSNNLALARERDELKQRFDGIDPEAVRKLAEEKRALEEAQQLKDGEFEKVLKSRLETQRSEFDKQFSTIQAERDALHAQLCTIQIDQAVVSEATKRGLRPSAIPDITSRARSTFRLVDGAPRAFEADGKTVRAGKDGVNAMTLAEWLDTQVSDAPHLFEANAGGGAAGGGGLMGSGAGGASVRGTTRNPFRRESWNLTEQMKLQRTDPALAARLKAAAA